MTRQRPLNIPATTDAPNEGPSPAPSLAAALSQRGASSEPATPLPPSLGVDLPAVSSPGVLYPTYPPPQLPFQRPSNRSSGGRRLALMLFGLVVTSGGAFIFFRRPHVITAPVERGTAVEAVYATGIVEAEERVTVKSKTSGTIELRVKEGSVVRKGDLLARIDSARLQAQLVGKRADQWAAAAHAGPDAPELASLEAEARAIEADIRSAKEDRERMAKLVASGAAPQPDLDRSSSRVSVLEARRDGNVATRRSLQIDLTARASGSSAAVHSLQAELADTEVRAPIDGVVLSRSVEPGETVPVNQPLFKIGDTAHLVLECTVDEADIGKVMLGKTVAVTLHAFPASVFRGAVFEIFPEADRVKKTFLAKVRLEAPPAGLRSGMSGEANIVIEQHPNALLVPSEAIDENGQVAVVRAGYLERVTATIGIRDMLRSEVLDGLAEGEPVVVSGADGQLDRARVTSEVRKAPAVGKSVSSANPARGGVSL